MRYYDVALGADKHWDESEFTYASEGSFASGQLVQVPFGKKSKAGYITRKTTRPSFPVKQLNPYENAMIPSKTRDFVQWYRQYYHAKPGQVYAQFLPHYLTKKLPKNLNTQHAEISSELPQLNKAQSTTVAKLRDSKKPAVLHGITGAGKTRVYLTRILETLANGRSALLLYPEIALTPQLLTEIEAVAPVAAFHSKLTDAERSKLWFRVATSGSPMAVIGPRSALFLPFNDLGLIIVDEAHESTYKQDTDIRYNGLMVAGGLAKAHGAQLILGSATPPITETELILKSGGSLVCLHEQAIENTHQKKVHIIDKKDRSLFKKHPLVADKLLSSVQSALEHNKQSLLFINRRGTAKLTLCEHCGWQASCPDCELPMTYHHDIHKLICHTCGKKDIVEPVCPDCSHTTTLKSLGSKAIVDEIQKLFSDARIMRFDSDNKKHESLSEVYERVKQNNVDILIGTQQLAKGLDLPHLSVVGVLDADLSLHFPDYSSDERTFQLLSQVSGRVGRGHGDGEIYIQTLHPANQTILDATTEDWHSFQEREHIVRSNHSFPPFTFAAKVIFREKSLDKAVAAAEQLKKDVESAGNLAVTTDGPLPSFRHKHAGFYFVQLHLKSKKRSSILKAIDLLPKDGIYDLDPISML